MLDAREAPGADGALPDATGIEVDGADPQLGDDTEGSIRGLAMRDGRMGVLGSTSPGDASPAPRSSDAAGLGVSGLLLPGSPTSHSHLSTGGEWRVTWSSFENKRGKLACAPLTPFEFSHFLLSLFL
jgi:hypothetical protein